MRMPSNLVSVVGGVLLIAGCGSDKPGTAKSASPAETIAVATGIPAQVAGQYELPESAHAQPLATSVCVEVTAEQVRVGKVPDGGAPKDEELPAEVVELEGLAATIDGLLPHAAAGPARAANEAPEEEAPEEEAPEEEALEEEALEEEEGGTGTKMALDEGKMGQRESSRKVGRYAMDEGAQDDPELEREKAMAKARKVGARGVLDGDEFATLTGTADFSSGLDDRTVYEGMVGDSIEDTASYGPIAYRISEDAPLLLADRNMKATRLVEVVHSLCHHGARVGVAQKGSPSAAEHPVKLGTLQPKRCPPARARGPKQERPTGPRHRIVVALLDSGYEVRGDEVKLHVDKATRAALGDALAGLRKQPDDRLELWVLVGKQAVVQDLAELLDAASAAKLDTVHVAELELLDAENKAEDGKVATTSPGLDDDALARWLAREPGSGGRDTGWGTIGEGRYGTIGHGGDPGTGYGTGPGRGSTAGREHSAPQVRIGEATVAGDLDPAIIRRYLRRKLPRIKYCYEKQLLVNAGLKGTVTTRFTIAPDGTVLKPSATGVAEEVSACIVTVLESIEFPKPRGGGKVEVSYPFVFRPDTP